MAKQVSLRDEIYLRLKKERGVGQSYTGFIEELLNDHQKKTKQPRKIC